MGYDVCATINYCADVLNTEMSDIYDLTNMPRCKVSILGFQMEVVADPASVKVNPNTQVSE